MTDPVSERPSALKRRARRPLHEAARPAYASTLGDAQREEKNAFGGQTWLGEREQKQKDLARAVWRRPRAHSQAFPRAEAPLHMQVPRRPAHAWHAGF